MASLEISSGDPLEIFPAITTSLRVTRVNESSVTPYILTGQQVGLSLGNRTEHLAVCEIDLVLRVLAGLELTSRVEAEIDSTSRIQAQIEFDIKYND